LTPTNNTVQRKAILRVFSTPEAKYLRYFPLQPALCLIGVAYQDKFPPNNFFLADRMTAQYASEVLQHLIHAEPWIEGTEVMQNGWSSFAMFQTNTGQIDISGADWLVLEIRQGEVCLTVANCMLG